MRPRCLAVRNACRLHPPPGHPAFAFPFLLRLWHALLNSLLGVLATAFRNSHLWLNPRIKTTAGPNTGHSHYWHVPPIITLFPFPWMIVALVLADNSRACLARTRVVLVLFAFRKWVEIWKRCRWRSMTRTVAGPARPGSARRCCRFGPLKRCQGTAAMGMLHPICVTPHKGRSRSASL